MNICNNCGWQNNHEGFCDRCGSALPILMKQNMPSNYGYNQYAQPVQKKKTLAVNNIYVIFSYISTFLATPIIAMSLIVGFFCALGRF